MRINYVELENIRSYEGGYEKNRMEFPEGSVLLAGDIGSGKSSLLLAIEFALFGIKRGELSGTSLLRRGTKSGGVRLNFTLQGKDITVERRLRRAARSVRQEKEGCYITIDGVRRQGLPEELKARVLELLGYPQELLKKQKSLIYRYTVYTPQEQMKRIVQADKEDRLDTLRKVFGVDRYKTIRENAGAFLTAVRQKRRELKVAFVDLDEKKEEKTQKKKELNGVKKLLQRLSIGKKKIETELGKWKKKKQRIEKKIKLYNKYKNELGKKEENKQNLEEQLEDLREEIEEDKEEVKKIDELKPPTGMSEKKIKKNVQNLDKKVEKCLKDNRGINNEIDALLKKKENSESSLEKKKVEITLAEGRIKSTEENLDKLIKAENKCPVCGKDLDEKHRKEKVREYEEEIDKNRKLAQNAKTDVETLTQRIAKLDEEIREKVEDVVGGLRKKKEGLEDTREKLGEYNEKLKEKERLMREISGDEKKERRLATKLSGVENRIKELQGLLEDLKNVEEQREKIEGKIEKVVNRLTEAEKKVAAQEANKSNLEKRLEEIKKEIESKKSAKSFWNRLGEYEAWFEDYLMPLTATIERHFMLELRRQFDPLFKDWFNMLIDDETLSVRIDDDFSPIIEQQGYEAEYENLSGGESTSVALAYRLALNKVVNTLVEDIRTRNLIILDEPTDGFSVDQLDKIRDVLEQLRIPQTIIVSHEPKIESYVENIIRIYKEGGISRID